MTAALPMPAADLLAARDTVDPECTYESYCYDAAEAVERVLAAAGIDAHLCDGGTVRDPSHCYVILFDGTIVDPTLDQFFRGGRGNTTGDWTDPVWAQRDLDSCGEELPRDNPWMGRLAVIAADDPFARHYYSHRLDSASWMYEDGYWVAGDEPAWWKALHRGAA